MGKTIEIENLKKVEKKYLKDSKNTVIRNALVNYGISDIISVNGEKSNIIQKFSIDNETLNITDQKASGRCWIFAGLNILREIIAKKCDIKKDFELSQNYVAFFDKLEKVNHAFNVIIELIDRKPNDRELMYILTEGIGDGGQWDMFVNVVKKYGVCPKDAFLETYSSSHTQEIDALINSVVRQFAQKVQKLQIDGKNDEISVLKESLLEKVYGLLCSCFGVPPTKFTFEYIDSKKKYHENSGFTPISFFEKFIGDEIDDYVSIINSPTQDKPFGKTYTIKYLGNVDEGKIVTHLNLEMTRIKELIINTLKDGNLVWFGSDVSSYRARALGAWDDKLFDYMSAFNLDVQFAKADMLDYHQSCMNHAMVITGVNLVAGKPTKWKIQNSWGDSGEKGFYVMSPTWFDTYVYQAVINKKYLSELEIEEYNKSPILLDPWDPMGTLAD